MPPIWRKEIEIQNAQYAEVVAQEGTCYAERIGWGDYKCLSGDEQNDREERACTDKLRARGTDNRNAPGFGWSCFTKQD